MEQNINQNRSLFAECGNFKVWTDTSYLDDPLTKRVPGEDPSCFFPTLHGGLEAFAASHPNGTLMNVIRNPEEWYRSAMKWRKFPERMAKQCSLSNSQQLDNRSGEALSIPAPGSPQKDWVNFYKAHSKHVRDFAAQHPSLTYVEVKLEDADTGKKLRDKAGIPEFCWGDCHPTKGGGPMCGVLRNQLVRKAG